MKIPSYTIVDNGDSAITIVFEASISEELSRIIIAIAEHIHIKFSTIFDDIIPGYQSLTLCYKIPDSIEHSLELQQAIIPIVEDYLSRNTLDKDKSGELISHQKKSKTIKIPVCYEEEFALDLSRVLQHTGLTSKELIALHSNSKYLVHMLGFMPGFLYLGGLDNKLHCPRKDNPATRIPAGSVGIGGQHTGIYPIAGPGGWNIIGQTPLRLFKPEQSNPFIASALDNVCFVPVSKKEYTTILERQEYGR